MSETLERSRTASMLADAHALVDDLLNAPLHLDADTEVLDALRELERLVCRLAAAEHRIVLQIEERGPAYTYSARDTAAVLAGALRIDPLEATARFGAAEAAGARREVNGDPAPASYPAVAAAQAAGSVSPRQAAVIVRCVETLPGAVQAEHGDRVEAVLVDYAGQVAPAQLAMLGIRHHDHLDPDGVHRDAKYRERIRDFTLHARPDGSSRVVGELTAELTARLQTHLDALAAPKPETDGVQDPRTAGQRRHDALLATLQLQQRAQLLPNTGGVSATIILTMDAETYQTGHGLATTGHGTLVPAKQALGWGGGDTRIIGVLLNKMKAIVGYSHTQRIFTEQQRLAITARDRGCTYPPAPPPPPGPKSTTSKSTAGVGRPASTTPPCCAGTTTETSQARLADDHPRRQTRLDPTQLDRPQQQPGTTTCTTSTCPDARSST